MAERNTKKNQGLFDVPSRAPSSRVLVVDDDPDVRSILVRVLQLAGHQVEGACDGQAALDLLKSQSFDIVLSDIRMPELDGVALLKAVRQLDPDVPVILMTGEPAIETAIQAVEYGALKYLTKPLDPPEVLKTVNDASRLRQMAILKRQALEYLRISGKPIEDRAGLEMVFNSALEKLWTAYQPIVRWSDRKVFAYEALVRTDEPRIPTALDFLDAAERLGRLPDLGRSIRRHVSTTLSKAPNDLLVFVNLHTRDLEDEDLYLKRSDFAKLSGRIVLEITERASLQEVKDVPSCVRRLRDAGFRIALDDLGSGYAGLNNFAILQPEVVKLDMGLIRGLHLDTTKRRIVDSMIKLCGDLGITVIAEGTETLTELEALLDSGCDLFQGYLFARPGPPFPEPVFPG
jgi:EAL domain-containing protein (putative c-di-GMP-specific phosphodiesterase class I)